MIKPEVVGDVTNVKASFQSPYGLIKSEWTKSATAFNLQVEIPANSTAVVYIPAKQDEVIILNNKRINIRYENGKAVVKIGSGSYHFVVRVIN
jgi:hypothetical protein